MERLRGILHCPAWQRALLAVLLVALGVRLVLWAQPLHEPANDEREYVAVANDLLAGNGWQFYESWAWLRAPLYPLWLAGSLWLANGDLHRAALPTILLSVGVVALFALLTWQVAGYGHPHPDARERRSRGWAAVVAAAFAAVLWTQATFASLYMSETLFAFLLAATFALLFAADTRPALWQAVGLVAVAGLCYGLASLTRSLPLAFAPLLALWLLLGARPRVQRVLMVAAFTLAAVLPLVPWTVRNCQTYESCILVETGFAYNMWAFNEPREGPETILETLEAIPDPAVRADEATRRGMERLREDPAIIARKLVPNWDYFWRIKPIQDRFLLASYFADPPPAVFLAALVFDDLLYVGLLVASVGGLTAHMLYVPARRRRLALLALWVLYVVAASMLTHGESRYRHFVFLVIIPCAALGVQFAWQWLRGQWQPPTTPTRIRQRIAWATAVAVAGVLLLTVGEHYPWQWAQQGTARSWHRLVGDVQRGLGNTAAAEEAYQRAIDANYTADGWLILGDMWRNAGDLPAAEEAYRRAWRQERHYIAASARLGDLLRATSRPDEARRAFEGFYVPQQQVLDWSWAHLTPPPTATIVVGDRLAMGYVGGMYHAETIGETRARWTNGTGMVRLPANAQGALVLQLTLAAPRPDGQPTPLAVCAPRRPCQTVTVRPAWRTVWLLLPPDPAPTASATQDVTLRSPTFRAPDGRTLGVAVSVVVAHLP